MTSSLVTALKNCRKIDDVATRAERQAAVTLVFRVLTELAGRVRVQGSPIPGNDRGDLVNAIVVGILERDGLHLETANDAGARSYLARMLTTSRLDAIRKGGPHRYVAIGDPETEAGTVDIDVVLHGRGLSTGQPVPRDRAAATARWSKLEELARDSCGEASFKELVELRLADDPADHRARLFAAEERQTGDAKRARDNVNQRISRSRRRLTAAIINEPSLTDDDRASLLAVMDALRERMAAGAATDPPNAR